MKTHRKNSSRRQQLAGLISGREKRRREIDRGKRIGIKIIPLDQISRKSAHYRPDERKFWHRAVGADSQLRCSHTVIRLSSQSTDDASREIARGCLAAQIRRMNSVLVQDLINGCPEMVRELRSINLLQHQPDRQQ